MKLRGGQRARVSQRTRAGPNTGLTGQHVCGSWHRRLRGGQLRRGQRRRLRVIHGILVRGQDVEGRRGRHRWSGHLAGRLAARGREGVWRRGNRVEIRHSGLVGAVTDA